MDRGTRRNRWDWQGRLAGVLLGAAGGVGIDLLGDEVGYQGVAMAIAAGALLSATSWLRSLPRRAPLVRHTVRALLMLSLAGVAGATFGPSSWTASLVLAVTVLIAAASLVANNTQATRSLLLGAGWLALGVAGVGAGVTLLIEGTAPSGVALVSFGAAYICWGVTVLIRGYAHVASGPESTAVLIVFAAACFITAITLLAAGDIPLAVASLGGGVAFISDGVAIRIGNSHMIGVARIGDGIPMISAGVVLLVRGHALLGAPLVGIGAATIAAGIATMIKSDHVLKATDLGAAMACVGAGVGLLLRGQIMIGIALLGGAAAVMSTVTTPGWTKWLQARLAVLTQEPTHPDTTDTDSYPASPAPPSDLG